MIDIELMIPFKVRSLAFRSSPWSVVENLRAEGAKLHTGFI
jgi:hypothetical protein